LYRRHAQAATIFKAAARFFRAIDPVRPGIETRTAIGFPMAMPYVFIFSKPARDLHASRPGKVRLRFFSKEIHHV
jgi:hypothetical protein